MNVCYCCSSPFVKQSKQQISLFIFTYTHTYLSFFFTVVLERGQGVECGEIMKNNAYFYMCICETCWRFYQEMASQTIDPLFPTQLVILLGGRLCRFTINLQIK